MANTSKSISSPVNTDDTITEIKEQKVVYENDSCDIKTMCTLNSSFSIIDRSKSLCETPTKILARNNRNGENNVCANSKKRKHSPDCDSRNINNSLKSQVRNSIHFNGFEPIVSHDFNTIITRESPEISLQEMTPENEVIKNEISYSSSPINFANNNEQLKLTKGSNNIKNTRIIPKKHNSKRNTTKKRDKKKENKDILEELEVVEGKEEISDIDREKLKNMSINLIHKVPPQHEIENCAASHVPTYSQTKLFKTYGPLRKGAFSQQEDEIIKKNWELFCKLHDWNEENVNPFLSFKSNGIFHIPNVEERQNFLKFLANGLPWRTLHGVYGRFKNLYRNHICRRYSLEEDKTILSYMQDVNKNKNNRKFSELAKILKRTRHSIWMHYQYLKKKHNLEEHNTSLSQIQWTLPLIKMYIKKLIKITKCQNIEELKNAFIPKAVWEKLQAKLNIDYKTLRKFWMLQLHMQLFCPNPIYLNDVKIQLIEYMYEKGISHAKEILWPNLIKYFDGMTTTFLNKIFTSLMKEFDVRKYKRKSFLDAIEYLYEKKITEIKQQKMDKYLPWIQYQNGKIKCLNKEKMDKPNNNHITKC